MKKWGSVLFLFVLIGCNEPELEEREVTVSELDEDVQTFYDHIEEENGVFLYQDGEKGAYVIINYANRAQNEAERKVEDFQVKKEGELLSVEYEERKGDSEGVYIYEVSYDKPYETIHLKKNGKDAYFQSVSGRN